ncbi:MAG: glutamate--tRNA ligase [Myxococcales bacterium]|nr:glutamate--tRNA ligase [Myxococcales bacterium]
MTDVRVRIAPSPTGDPHVGTGYVALFNYAYARRHGGKFLLRIEDTDQQRSSRESEEAIMRSLRWLGLDWDEGPDVGGPHGPYRQSERAQIYREHAKMLVDKGAAYRCFCTPERLAELRTHQRENKLAYGYDGHCRGLEASGEADKRAAAGEAHVVRLLMPDEGETVLDDQLRGEVRLPNSEVDDQVLLKSDGLPTYHLANVVDDHLMKISHVIRAEEWISSAPKHLRLYEAFGWQAPRFVHLPLLRNADKNRSKISKRKNPVSLEYYRDIGILPHAMVNFLALLGWSFGDDIEKFTLEQMVERFDLVKGSVNLTGPVFDLEKLAWLNGKYLQELDDEQLADAFVAWRVNRDFLVKLAPLFRERIRKLDELMPQATYFFCGDIDYTQIEAPLLPKNRTPKETRELLGKLVDKLDTLRSFEVEPLEELFREFCEESGWKTRDVFMLTRLIVTGRKASPPLFDTIKLVGRDRVRRRFRLAIEHLKTVKAPS